MPDRLALFGGRPVRDKPLPYARQDIDEADISAVVRTLQSDWLTTGPAVEELERAFTAATDSAHAVAVSNGTAALHCAAFAAGVGSGDEVIVPAITFAASSNAVLYCGGTPVFADVEPETLLLDLADVARRIGPKTKAIVSVDYAGQAADYDGLRELADEHGLVIIADACHALGGTSQGRKVGSLADLSTFSLHPAKHVTSGEGGVITTDDADAAARMRVFRNHGITSDHRTRAAAGAFAYEMVELGYNYRLSDIQCALAVSQLRRLGQFVTRRQEIARRFDEAFSSSELEFLTPLSTRAGNSHAHHLYVVRVRPESGLTRGEFYSALRAEGINANVHYSPVYRHPYYRDRLGYSDGACPNAETVFDEILSLPMFSAMTDADVDDVIAAVRKVYNGLRANAASKLATA